MQYIAHTVWFAGAASAADKQGPGALLRTVLAVLLVGAVLMAWFLLRGYRSDRSPENGAVRQTPKAGGGDASGTGGEDVSGARSAQQDAGASAAAGRARGENGDVGRKP
ncbi:hypothetical protein [Streptomyces sp. TS71-3]|uniref:hypothetical protein n=1 Tax=Streptomyces sp. TS71-3 TaxID=2733862 RepID=UPI001B20A2B5|nr:hypothetical protein [Streptomyces sp. TS71-3]GHJ37642.1 hypothetical protein Sm713_32510 [Streptomyces sp. TS71-3]